MFSLSLLSLNKTQASVQHNESRGDPSTLLIFKFSGANFLCVLAKNFIQFLAIEIREEEEEKEEKTITEQRNLTGGHHLSSFARVQLSYHHRDKKH